METNEHADADESWSPFENPVPILNADPTVDLGHILKHNEE